MPFFDYQCPACTYTTEVEHGIKSSVVIQCPKCKSQKLHRIISPVPSHFKGKGWAKDNYSP